MTRHSKLQILAVLEVMPEEAFGYIVEACAEVVRQYEGNHGFHPASTQSFVLLARALNVYADTELIDMAVVRRHNPTLFDPNQ